MESADGNKLGRVHGIRAILRFTLPSILTMLFISSYSIVDGLFISNFIGTDGLASMNILIPAVTLITGLGFMFATGGSAYVANLLGRGESEKASRSFSLIVYTAALFGIMFTIAGFLLLEPVVRLLGADDLLTPGSEDYGRGFLPFIPFLILQFLFTQFLIVAGRPTLSLTASIGGGITNIILDYLLIAVFDFGLVGAAVASGMGSLVPAVIGIVFFLDRRRPLHLSLPSKEFSAIDKTCSNGMSEMVSELSGGVTTLCYNLVMMHYIGADGVSAISIVSYVQFLALAAMIGYSNGIAPVMSYNHGAGNKRSMQHLLKVSVLILSIMSLFVFAMMELFTGTIAGLFASSSDSVMDITVHGARIFSIGFLFMGMNLYASSLFTSLSNGPVSALISAVRSVILLAPLIIILPMAFGIDAVWYAVPITEIATLVLSGLLLIKHNKDYGYFASKESVC